MLDLDKFSARGASMGSVFTLGGYQPWIFGISGCKAYRLIAMQCHPDKGGDKEDFQELMAPPWKELLDPVGCKQPLHRPSKNMVFV